MTSDERTLISTLFDRLNQAAAQPKDAEADDYIRAKVLEQPAAPYLLVQSTLVMQQALAAAQSRIASLEKRLTEARPSQESGGSFLSGVANLFGVGQPSPQPAPRSVQTPPPLPPRPAPASGYAPPSTQQTASGGGGGFLQGALSTAAGVAGGALLFQGIQNLIGHNPGPFEGLSGPSGGLISGNEPVVENTEVVNNFIEDPSSTTGQSATQDTSSDATADTDPATDPNSDDSFAADDGSDFGGGDDYV